MAPLADSVRGATVEVIMRVYISSPGWKVLNFIVEHCPDVRLNILLTAARMPRRYKEYLTTFSSIIESVILDNGAFSAMKSKLDISLSQLLERFTIHSRLNQNRYLMVFSPDFEFGPDGFEANFNHLLDMEALNIMAVPVIHNLKNHEAWTYSQILPEFIAIGQSKSRRLASNLFPVVYRLYHEKQIKVHLFGMTEFPLISGCPAYSCDSKSWIDDAKTGVVRFWNPEKKERNKTDVIYFPEDLDQRKPNMFSRYEYPGIDVFNQFLKDQLGISIDDFIGSKRMFYRQVALVLYYHTLEKVVTELHLHEGIVF